MDKSNNLINDLFTIEVNPVSTLDFAVNLLLTILLGYILGWVYGRFGNVLSNRKMLSTTLLLVAVNTMIIITIVKSSLALSLGLVGALSIVRFRTAIKEPEELAYFFISIAIGLGMGAGQRMITLIGAVVLILLITLKGRGKSKSVVQNLIVNIPANGEGKLDLDSVVEVLRKNSKKLELKRMDKTDSHTEISFLVEMHNYNSIGDIQRKLEKRQANVGISFLENSLV